MYSRVLLIKVILKFWYWQAKICFKEKKLKNVETKSIQKLNVITFVLIFSFLIQYLFGYIGCFIPGYFVPIPLIVSVSIKIYFILCIG